MLTPSNEFKGRVHAKMTVMFMFIHLCVIAKLCDFLSLNTYLFLKNVRADLFHANTKNGDRSFQGCKSTALTVFYCIPTLTQDNLK